MPVSIGFFGSPDFSARLLESIINANVAVDFVVTNIDKPVGRKKELASTPVKEMALKYSIPVLQSARLRSDIDIQTQINSFSSGIHVVFAYGSIIPELVFTHPKFGSINLHGSLLPMFRGASPVQSFLMSGEKRTGYSIQSLANEVDAGDIICSEEWDTSLEDTTQSLLNEITLRGSKKIIEILKELPDKMFSRTPQEHAKTTHCKKITAENRPILWTKSAREIHDQIRALYPDPLAYTSFRGKRVILIKARLGVQTEVKQEGLPGSFFIVDKKRLFCVCGDGNLIVIETLQPEGKKPMSGVDYFNGARILPGETFL